MIQEFIGTGYVLNRAHTKILLIHHRKFGKWLPPGGHCDPGEAPHTAAKREVFEETGVVAEFIFDEKQRLANLSKDEEQVPAPIFVLKEFIAGKFGKGEDHFHIDFMYLMEAKEDSLVKSEREILDAGWFDLQQVKNLPTFSGFSEIISKILQ